MERFMNSVSEYFRTLFASKLVVIFIAMKREWRLGKFVDLYF